MNWKLVLILAGLAFVVFVIGVYVGERDRRPNHSARIWRNF